MLKNSPLSYAFGSNEGIRIYHDLVREDPGLKDLRVIQIAEMAVDEAMEAVGEDAAVIDPWIARGAVLVAIENQTLGRRG